MPKYLVKYWIGEIVDEVIEAPNKKAAKQQMLDALGAEIKNLSAGTEEVLYGVTKVIRLYKGDLDEEAV